MLIHLDREATTTPKIQASIQASDEPARVLVERFGTTEQAVWKWRKRDSVHDRTLPSDSAKTTHKRTAAALHGAMVAQAVSNARRRALPGTVL
jgi:hypothetical protein